jgi:hypothetical protein
MSSPLISTSNGSPACGDYLSLNESINEIHDVPMKEISRPLPSILDENKVQSLIETIQVRMKEIFRLFIRDGFCLDDAY